MLLSQKTIDVWFHSKYFFPNYTAPIKNFLSIGLFQSFLYNPSLTGFMNLLIYPKDSIWGSNKQGLSCVKLGGVVVKVVLTKGPVIHDVSIFWLFLMPSLPLSASVGFLPQPHTHWVLMWHLTHRGLYQCLIPDYAQRCRTSTLMMVPINFWRNSDPFEKEEVFLAQRLKELEHFL